MLARALSGQPGEQPAIHSPAFKHGWRLARSRDERTSPPPSPPTTSAKLKSLYSFIRSFFSRRRTATSRLPIESDPFAGPPRPPTKAKTMQARLGGPEATTRLGGGGGRGDEDPKFFHSRSAARGAARAGTALLSFRGGPKRSSAPPPLLLIP